MIDIFNPGGLPYVETPTDIKWSELGAAIAPNDRSVPYNIEDELGIKLPINDQGQSTSCGGQAFSKYNAVRAKLRGGEYVERSAAYVYRQTAVVSNGVALGSYLGDNAHLDYTQGVCYESLCSSNPQTDAHYLNVVITEAMRQNALLSKGETYAFLIRPTIDQVAQAIKHNGGCVMLLAGENNGTWFSAFPKPPTYRQWGHFMYFGKVRTINGKFYVGGLQSWGSSVGSGDEPGWQWFGEEWFNGQWMEAGVTIVMKPLPAPPSYQFTRDLTIGSVGEDVRFLQVYLNKNGFPVASSGPGSPGNETNYFGSLTRSALAKFQAAKGIKPSVGYFGPITRGYVNSH